MSGGLGTDKSGGARTFAEFGMETRAKYTDDQIEKLGLEGKAFRNPDGHYSFPIVDYEDLQGAIKAVGRSGADHNEVRAFIISRAKAMGQMQAIPDLWCSDGRIETSRAFVY